MSVLTITVLALLILFLLFWTGLEIAFAMAAVGFIGYAAVVGVAPALKLTAMTLYSSFSSFNLLALVLFVLMGQIAANAGMSKKLYDSAYKFVGHIPGGLVLTTIIAAAIFKTMCGSSAATAATFATFSIPEMDRHGYDKRISTGTVATVGSLGSIIPPSVALIVYGLITDTSIGRLFLAGIIPGILFCFSFVATVWIWVKMDPKIAPRGERSQWGERIRSTQAICFPIVVFVLLLGGLTKGYFTPTEAGGVGAAVVLLVSFLSGNINLKGIVASVKQALVVGCMILTLIMTATILSQFFAVTQVPYIISNWVGSLQIYPFMIIIILVLLFLFLGEFIEDMAVLILLPPIFLPTILKLGYDPVWFGIIICSAAMIGIVIPPMAINVFVVAGIAKVPLNTVYKGIYPYLVGMSIVLLLLIFFPQISLFLPNLFFK